MYCIRVHRTGHRLDIENAVGAGPRFSTVIANRTEPPLRHRRALPRDARARDLAFARGSVSCVKICAVALARSTRRSYWLLRAPRVQSMGFALALALVLVCAGCGPVEFAAE